jgi:serine O-acetyltransferase
MSKKGIFKLIRSDLSRFTETYQLRNQKYSKFRILLESLVFKANFQAVLLYRLSHFLHQCGLTYAAWALSRFNLAFTGAEIEFNAKIGEGLFISHPCGIVIGRGTVIGSRATIFQGVTFGVKSWDPNCITKFPKVGNGCFFFANSVIIGDISIGDNCIIAAHSLVNKDVPEGHLAKGVPAKATKPAKECKDMEFLK